MIHDFEPALKMNPNSGIARLGLFPYLQLHRSREALAEINMAEKSLGELGATHMGAPPRTGRCASWIKRCRNTG